ncbi:MAG: phytanoyl-CoA dioxygenase family protein [Pseudomonadota bacterium]
MTPKMEPFLDSTDVMDDGARLRERLERDGYLFVRGLLPPDAIEAVRERLLAKAARGGWLDPTQPITAGIANQDAACKDPEDAYMAVFRDLWADEKLHRLRTHPRVMALFERIFGESVLVHPMFVQRNIFPQSDQFDFTTQPHQDKVHIGGDTNYAMWVPLGDCPMVKGSLAVATGSHRAGVLDTRVGTGAGGMDIAVPITGQWVCDDFYAGDVLIFSDVAVHCALPNRTDELRQSFDARYQPLSQRVADKNLDTYAGTGSWEEVYSGWENAEGQYYWRELALNVVPLDMSYYERRDEMAFAMAENGDLASRDALLRIIQRDASATKRSRASELLAQLDG